MKAFFLLVVLTLLAATGAIAATDPFAGTWVLDPSRSEYPDGQCPKSMTIEMATLGGGVRYRSDATFADGRTIHAEYTANYNGNQVLVTGKRGFLLPVSLQRIDPRTVVASYTKGLLVIATSRRVVSEDGHQMTVTTTSTDASGKNLTTIGVYEKRPD